MNKESSEEDEEKDEGVEDVRDVRGRGSVRVADSDGDVWVGGEKMAVRIA